MLNLDCGTFNMGGYSLHLQYLLHVKSIIANASLDTWNEISVV